MKTLKMLGFAATLFTSVAALGQDIYYGGLKVPSELDGFYINFEGSTNSISAVNNVLNINGSTKFFGSTTLAGTATVTGALTASNALSIYSLHKFTNTGVGLGTTTPSALLHINNGTGTATYKNANLLALTTNGVKGSFFFGNTLATSGYSWSYDGSALSLDELVNGVVIPSPNSVGGLMGNVMKINNNSVKNGRVEFFRSIEVPGIQFKNSGGPCSMSMSPCGINLYNAGANIDMTNGITYNFSGYIGVTQGNAFTATKGDVTINNGKFMVNNGSTPSLIVDYNGNVSIGTATVYGGTDAYKLSVNGKVACKELKVDANWADYVFAKDYKLRSLSEVENYIKENKHLPDVKSASDIEANGLKVGEMQSTMMQKIEELTLYIIEQQKQIESLKAAMETMK